MASKKKSGGPMATCLIVAGVLVCLSVPIIGILAAIAVPNFMRFQCKAKQSEAKTNLAGLFTAEKAFQADFGYYTSDLVSLGWTPHEAPAYVYGFAYAGPEDLGPSERKPADYDSERKDTVDPSIAGANYQTNRMIDGDGNKLLSTDLPEDSWVERARFKAAAIADLSKDDEGRLDVWTIDENRNLVNVVDDCK